MKIRNKLILALGLGLNQPIKAEVTKQDIKELIEIISDYKKAGKLNLSNCFVCMLQLIKVETSDEKLWEIEDEEITEGQKKEFDTIMNLISESRSQIHNRDNLKEQLKNDLNKVLEDENVKEEDKKLIEKYSSIIESLGPKNLSHSRTDSEDEKSTQGNASTSSSSEEEDQPQGIQEHSRTSSTQEDPNPSQSPQNNTITQNIDESNAPKESSKKKSDVKSINTNANKSNKKKYIIGGIVAGTVLVTAIAGILMYRKKSKKTTQI